MPRDNTYFEEASKLFHEGDMFISIVSDMLHRNMLHLYLEKGLSPASPDTFNILYFFQIVIRALLMEHPEVTLTSKSFPYPCERINAVNWPEGSVVWSKDNSATLIRYLDLIKEDSDLSGGNFDVNYSLKILIWILNNYNFFNTDNYFIKNSKGYLGEQFDRDLGSWLSGFYDGQP